MEPDTVHHRAVVLPFRSGRRSLGRASRHFPNGAAAAVALDVRAGDAEINADWDLLIRVASHAWSWRDPDSLDTLERTVSRLRTWIARDWPA